MGGRGSGCYIRSGAKSTTEDGLSIDIRWLQRHSCLTPGRQSSLKWSRLGRQTGGITIVAHEDHIQLLYNYRRGGVGDWQDVKQQINFTWTDCHYGGRRRWFICPFCSRRVAVLYGPGKHFACRHCYGLGYESQRENRASRMYRKAGKIRERLGASPAPIDPIWRKPKGMHYKTFSWLKLQAELLEDRALFDGARRLGLKF